LKVSAKPKAYRAAAERLRQLAEQSLLPDIVADLMEIAARFERMAAYYDAAARLNRNRELEHEAELSSRPASKEQEAV
jgi:hypothetical protein